MPPRSHVSRVAVVTGAGSGIGRAVALALLREGYEVVLAGRRAELLESARREADGGSERAIAVPTDVRDPSSVRALFEKAVSSYGRLDLLFNNAGVNAPGIAL